MLRAIRKTSFIIGKTATRMTFGIASQMASQMTSQVASQMCSDWRPE